MHRPPAAAWKAGSAQGQRRLVLALVLLGCGVWLGFGASQGWGRPSLVLGVSLVACSVLAAWSHRGTAQGQLRWDGEHWHWCAASDLAVVHLHCALDLQRLLLLHISCAQGPRLWLWLESRQMDARWLALRRAVVASRGLDRSAAFHSLP